MVVVYQLVGGIEDIWDIGDMWVGQDGCIYFAPCIASRVLRIAVDGNVEQVRPEIPVDSVTWRYGAGGVVGQDGCIYFAPCDASRVLCIAVD